MDSYAKNPISFGGCENKNRLNGISGGEMMGGLRIRPESSLFTSRMRHPAVFTK